MPHHASAPTFPAVPPRSDPPTRQPPPAAEALGIFAGLVAAEGGDVAVASKPSLGFSAASRETSDDTASAGLLHRTSLKAVQSGAGAAQFDAALECGAVVPVETIGSDAGVAPPAVPAVSGGDAAMVQMLADTLDVTPASTLAEAASAADQPADDESVPATPLAITLPPLLADAVQREADAPPPPPNVSADTITADIATRSPPVLIALANTIGPQREITRTAAGNQTAPAAVTTDALPKTQARATAVDAIGAAAAAGAPVAQPDAVMPAAMSAAEDPLIATAKAEGASANVGNSHREKVSGQHPDVVVERAAVTPKWEADELRRDVPPVPTVTPSAHAAGAATSPMASIAIANATAAGAIASPLNVAGTAAAPHAETPEAGVPITGLAVEIAARSLEGKRRFEIRLDPPELGRIDVRLDVGRDGQVTSRLVVERAETLDLLRRDAPTLERALQSAGLRTDDAGLQFSLRDQSGGRWAGVEATPRSHLLIVPDEDVAVREAVRRGYGVLRGLGRGIDIRV